MSIKRLRESTLCVDAEAGRPRQTSKEPLLNVRTPYSVPTPVWGKMLPKTSVFYNIFENETSVAVTWWVDRPIQANASSDNLIWRIGGCKILLFSNKSERTIYNGHGANSSSLLPRDLCDLFSVYDLYAITARYARARKHANKVMYQPKFTAARDAHERRGKGGQLGTAAQLWSLCKLTVSLGRIAQQGYSKNRPWLWSSCVSAEGTPKEALATCRHLECSRPSD